MPRLSHRPRLSENTIGMIDRASVTLSTRAQILPGPAASAARHTGVSMAQVEPQAFV